jgi:hypothetical protein
VSVTSDSKGMSILPALTELTHLFGILQVLSGLTAVVATVDSMVGTSSLGPRGVEPLPKKAHISALLRVSSWYVCGAARAWRGFLPLLSSFLNSKCDFLDNRSRICATPIVHRLATRPSSPPHPIPMESTQGKTLG